MSTFNGLVDEFPDIRIDHFRSHASIRSPAACFLSHVHSDHLLGLDSLKMPFVYCSAVTRNILLRMEKYPHRINFQKGILECRKQTYRHLSRVLRPLPLEAPIELELRPKLTIQVTLFDANHCPGAVMFLIEGSGKAVLYTGDVRAEPWWVNAIVRNPMLLPYCCGKKTLDCIYLDTTFASHDDIHRNFPTKAEGLKELLEKVDRSAPGSVFYFRAWTLGYEDVWVALANHLRQRIHVDDYKLRLYSSLAEDGVQQGATLIGAQVGNFIHPGCLSNEVGSAIHSCEPGMDCHRAIKTLPNIVWITPIISRMSDGTELAEMGAGGGSGDLNQISELDLVDDASIVALRIFCASILTDRTKIERIESMLEASGRSQALKVSLEGLGLNLDEEFSLRDFVKLLSKHNRKVEGSHAVGTRHPSHRQEVIHFPYSRHSSLCELRDLVSRFRPRDICPCTVDLEVWSENVSMQALFGDFCSEQIFEHDATIRARVLALRPEVADARFNRKRKREPPDSQETASEESQQLGDNLRTPDPVETNSAVNTGLGQNAVLGDDSQNAVVIIDDDDDEPNERSVTMYQGNSHSEAVSDISLPLEAFDSQQSQDDEQRHVSIRNHEERLSSRVDAYQSAKSYLSNDRSLRLEGLRIRSCGWKGHTEEELIL